MAVESPTFGRSRTAGERDLRTTCVEDTYPSNGSVFLDREVARLFGFRNCADGGVGFPGAWRRYATREQRPAEPTTQSVQ